MRGEMPLLSQGSPLFDFPRVSLHLTQDAFVSFETAASHLPHLRAVQTKPVGPSHG